MRKFLVGLALLAPPVSGQTLPVRGQSGYDTGPVVNCTALDGSGTARCLMPGMVPYDTTGTPLGTATNPINVTGGGGGGGGGGNSIDATGTGTLALATANSTYVIALTGGRNAIGARVSGLSGSGAVVTVERSNDGGTTWTNANTTESSATGSLSATLTADGQPRINAAGATNIRFRVSTAGTGTASIAYNATTASGPIFLTGYIPGRATPDGLTIGGVDNRWINGIAISTGAGATDTGTQRVSLATDGNQATAANQTAGNNSLTTLAGTVGTNGSPTTSAQTVQGTTLTTLANTVTNAGTAATTAQAIQGVTGGVALPISGNVTPADTTCTAAAYDGTNNKTTCGYQKAIADQAISTAPSAVNLSQVGGATVLTGLGTGTGALRTVLSTDSTIANTSFVSQGAVTTAAPTYTTGTNNSLSLTTAGAVRVDGSATTQPISGTQLATISGQLSSARGIQTSANSMSVAPSSDGVFATQQGLGATALGGAAATTVTASAANQYKATSGNLASLNLVNSTVAGFVAVLDVAAAPTAGATITAAQLKWCMPIAASAGMDTKWPVPLNTTNGIHVAVLTSCTVYTTIGTAPVSMSAQYK